MKQNNKQPTQKPPGKLRGPIAFFLISPSFGVRLAKILIMLVTPYCYLLVCGLVFDRILKWYFMTSFIFFSFIFLCLLAMIGIICAIRWRNKT